MTRIAKHRLGALFVLMLLPSQVIAQTDDPDTLVLRNAPACLDRTHNAFEDSQCIAQEAQKADGWLMNVFASNLRAVEAKVAEWKKAGLLTAPGVDPIARLKHSQELFEQYREQMSAFVYEENYTGSLRVVSAPAMKLRLTIDRTMQLLQICNPRAGIPDVVDLKQADWCEAVQ